VQISLKTALISAQGADGVNILGKQIVLEGDSICLKSGGNFVRSMRAAFKLRETLS